ncbi:uncharacterized protein [Gossypium hirsutum]|uniref:Uncharacterized protein n=1 Tax=Gossypium hirsutum TaxID=3635 RepID=A0A1U8JPY3_GOSHI|nr:uncharacterized protein LOC107908030 [Gossypium hirsutum]
MSGDKIDAKYAPSSVFMEEINWDTLLLEVDLPDLGDILDNEPKQIEEIEKVLMGDDNFNHRVETQFVPDDDFLADLLVDSPPCSGGNVVGVDGGDLHKQSQTHININKDDPIAKKQKRQLRNKDAAMR